MTRTRTTFVEDSLAAAAGRRCDMPSCDCPGAFRAPKGRDRLTDYYWFCLDHVRAYNSAWDYYAGMEPAEIEAEIRADTTWQRPTWRFGERHATTRRFDRAWMRDDFGFFEAEPGAGADAQRRPRPGSAEERALAVLDLAPPVDFAAVRARYKELVKRHHPDANGGDKGAEERLKLINEAYATLRAALAPG